MVTGPDLSRSSAPCFTLVMSQITSYFLLSDLNLDVKVKVNALLGKSLPDELDIKSRPGYSPTTVSREAELFVTCQIFANGKPIGVQCSTTYACFPTQSMRWEEWLTFPLKYRDLSHSSHFVFTVWELSHTNVLSDDGSGKMLWHTESCQQAIPLGGTTMPMFNKHGVLKVGRRYLKLWPGVEGDGSVESSTPHRIPNDENDKHPLVQLEKVMRGYQQKALPNVKWLNKLTQRKIEKMSSSQDHPKRGLCLIVDFPPFKFPIVYHEKTCNSLLKDLRPIKDKDRLFILHDPEMTKDNPIERKYHKLAGSSKGLADRDLKPKIAERNRINEIIQSPSKHLSQEERRLIWKFRFTLTENKTACTKFLRCVDWEDPKDVKQALELLGQWAPIDIADALELLGDHFRNKDVRRYAVKQLEKADDAELNSYLLQIVQGLRYEDDYPSELSRFLFRRATGEMELCNFFYWFLSVESHDQVMGKMYKVVLVEFLEELETKKPEWSEQISDQLVMIKDLISLSEHANRVRRVDKKVEKMRSALAEEGEFKHLRDYQRPVRLPVRPDIRLVGIMPEKSTMFKSALAPMLVGFKTVGADGEDEKKENHRLLKEKQTCHRVIFKCGDDLRQDQLMIQMINLMDSLLKKVNLDLKLTP